MENVYKTLVDPKIIHPNQVGFLKHEESTMYAICYKLLRESLKAKIIHLQNLCIEFEVVSMKIYKRCRIISSELHQF